MNTHQKISHILKNYQSIAVVGFSSRLSKAGFYVPEYMQRHGYMITPVNPNLRYGLGEKAFPDLSSIPHPIEVVEVFRRPEFVVSVVEEAIAVGAKAVWLQRDIVSEEACLLYTSPSPRDLSTSRMPSSA